MTAEDFFRTGQLAAAIDAQVAVVKKAPAETQPRFYLAALLAFAGERDRAMIHLDNLAHHGEKHGSLVTLFSSLLAAEEERRRVYDDGHHPGLPPQGAEDAQLRLELLAGLRGRDEAKVAELLDKTESTAPVAARINGKAYTSVQNHDEVLGPVVECFAGGRCLWVPLRRIRTLTFSKPANVMDLLWREAELVDVDGKTSRVHVPVLYAGSDRTEDEKVKLGRATIWESSLDMVFRGKGQNTIAANSNDGGAEPEELPILTIEQLAVGGES